MAVSTIDRVREAEQKANAMQDEAEAKAAQIIADAEERAKSLTDAAKQKAEEFDRRAEEEAKARADAIAAARREKAQEEAAALTEKTVKLRQNVINKLIQETLC